jgi:hypothetical protein
VDGLHTKLIPATGPSPDPQGQSLTHRRVVIDEQDRTSLIFFSAA